MPYAHAQYVYHKFVKYNYVQDLEPLCLRLFGSILSYMHSTLLLIAAYLAVLLA